MRCGSVRSLTRALKTALPRRTGMSARDGALTHPLGPCARNDPHFARLEGGGRSSAVPEAGQSGPLRLVVYRSLYVMSSVLTSLAERPPGQRELPGGRSYIRDRQGGRRPESRRGCTREINGATTMNPSASDSVFFVGERSTGPEPRREIAPATTTTRRARGTTPGGGYNRGPFSRLAGPGGVRPRRSIHVHSEVSFASGPSLRKLYADTDDFATTSRPLPAADPTATCQSDRSCRVHRS